MREAPSQRSQGCERAGLLDRWSRTSACENGKVSFSDEVRGVHLRGGSGADLVRSWGRL